MDERPQQVVLAAGLVAGAVCAAASLQLSKYWPLAAIGWLVAVGCAAAVTWWGTGWRRRSSIALLIGASLALLSFVAFVGVLCRCTARSLASLAQLHSIDLGSASNSLAGWGQRQLAE